MAVVFPGKLVYLATPQTASVATAKGLSELLGGGVVYDKKNGVGHHSRLPDVAKAASGTINELKGNEFVVTTVRNPYDIMASKYVLNRKHYQVRFAEEDKGRTLTMAEFVDLWWSMSPFPDFYNRRLFYHDEHTHAVIRYERLATELGAVIRKRRGLGGLRTIPPINRTSGKSHWSAYFNTNEDLEAVNDCLVHEFIKYGYPIVRTLAALGKKPHSLEV